MSFRTWIIELLQDERGSTSIKPVVALMGSIFLCATMLLNSFSSLEFQPSPELINAVMIITAIGMGADSLDKFTHKKKDEPTI